jgi:hypothetical protein
VFEHFSDCEAIVDVAIEHCPDEVNACFRERKEGDAEWVVEDFVDVVEGVLLVDNGIQENAQGPDVLFLASVRPALENFGGGVV